jgi:hypothetical protein
VICHGAYGDALPNNPHSWCRATFHIRVGRAEQDRRHRVVEGHPGEILGTTCGAVDSAIVPPITADVGMHIKVK